jgi:hypothetical protein
MAWELGLGRGDVGEPHTCLGGLSHAVIAPQQVHLQVQRQGGGVPT